MCLPCYGFNKAEIDKMRLFIAICLDDKIKNEISALQKEINIQSLNPKWVPSKDCHITLKFLGQVEKENLPKIIAICKDVLSKYTPFFISFGTLGAFPSLEYPRVIFIGLEDGYNTIFNIANSLEDGLFKIGFEKEKRPFSAHLTIARIKYPQKTKALSPYLSKRFIPFKMDVKEIFLIESKLLPSRPIYIPIMQFPL